MTMQVKTNTRAFGPYQQADFKLFRDTPDRMTSADCVMQTIYAQGRDNCHQSADRQSTTSMRTPNR